MLGSIDANTGSPDLGWDTDQFPMDIRACTAVMKTVLEQVFYFIPRGHCLGPRSITTELLYVQGGLQPGGLNFDAKVRRESTEVEDLFIAHISAMDSLARGLRNAARIIEEGVLKKIIEVTRKILLNENVYLSNYIYRFIEGALWILQIKHWFANK